MFTCNMQTNVLFMLTFYCALLEVLFTSRKKKTSPSPNKQTNTQISAVKQFQFWFIPERLWVFQPSDESQRLLHKDGGNLLPLLIQNTSTK